MFLYVCKTMNIRPRCHEWLPLSTQQLRLRNLQAIQGVNFDINAGGCSNLSPDVVHTQILLYYTLHNDAENNPFYQSEKIALRKHLNLKWAEIQCPEILKSNENCVCIKIWACIEKTEHFGKLKYDKSISVAAIDECNKSKLLRKNQIKEPMSALTREIDKFQKLPRSSDSLICKWAVYFSGLIPLSQNTEIKCCANTLIFQMNDQYFGSPERFSTEGLRGQLALNYERYSASVPKCSIPTTDEFTINSPQVSRSSSPVCVDWQKDLLRMSKTRYLQLNCVRCEVRPSYDLIKLLKLQKFQRQRMQIQRELEEITGDIKCRSLRCITKEQLVGKGRATSINLSNSTSATAAAHHSMGRTLSLLLAEQHRIEPFQLLQAQQLQAQLETVRSKRRLLMSAQATLSNHITDLREQLNNAASSRQEKQAWLSEQLRKLDDDKLKLQRYITDYLENYKRKHSIAQHVECITFSLCLELRDIYPIYRNQSGLYTICGVPFPKMDGYFFDSTNTQSVNVSDNVSPMALSASLGYVAHLVEMISVILNRPLRNPIIYEGSRTRIMDVIKDNPSYSTREFPLYSRSSIPTKPVKYAINLLNQNIAQLCFTITGLGCNVRNPIENLKKIFTTFQQIEKNKFEIHMQKSTLNYNPLTIKKITNTSETEGSKRYHEQHHNSLDHIDDNQMLTKNYEYNSLSKSHSSVDMNDMIQPITTMDHHHRNVPVFCLTTDKFLQMSRSSHAIDMQERSVLIGTNKQRNCHSVGSYTDSEEEVYHATGIKVFSNSESDLTSLQGASRQHHA